MAEDTKLIGHFTAPFLVIAISVPQLFFVDKSTQTEHRDPFPSPSFSGALTIVTDVLV